MVGPSSSPKVVVVVQARMGSSRLPAKVLLDLGGEIALHRTLSRAARIPGVHQVVVATSTEPADEVIAWAAEARGFSVTRGSEKDVLSRFLLAAQIHQADVIMRVTSDCPLLDPAVSGLVLDGFLRSGTLGYASNVVTRALPRGLDTEVFSRAALERAADSTDARAREHVTWGMYSHPDKFRCGEFLPAWVVPGLAAHRWTLDTLADYHFLASIYHRLGPTAGAASAQEVLDLLRREPALQAINADISQVAV